MPRYRVYGYQHVFKWGYVEAESEEDAIEKGFAGALEDVYVSPGGHYNKPHWTAEAAGASGSSPAEPPRRFLTPVSGETDAA